MSVTCLLQANAVSFKFHSDLSRTSLRVKVVSTATRKRARVYPCVACTSTTDVVVIGAGAAGLTAAYFAAQNGAQVTVLEKNQQAGRKILISGGTRCNVLPSRLDISQDYFTESSKSAIKAVFASWTLDKCKEWLESWQHIGLALAHEVADSKYFPVSNSAKEVRDKLVLACLKAGVKFRYDARVARLQQSWDTGKWQCKLAAGPSVEAQSIVLASGGLSYPHLGTDGDGHRMVKELGHSLHPTYPALTPLLGSHPGNSQLAGLSLYGVDAAVQGPKSGKKGKRSSQRAQRGGMLFTHKGFSGPAVLDLSHHKVMAMLRGTPQPDLRLNWTGLDAEAWQAVVQAGGPSAVQAVLHRQGLPKRLAEAICQELDIVGTPMAQLRKQMHRKTLMEPYSTRGNREQLQPHEKETPNAESGPPSDHSVVQTTVSAEFHLFPTNLLVVMQADKLRMLELLTAYKLNVTGHGGFAKAEVTGGGVPLSEINCATMESKRLAGMYLCGEICDVFGRIGGFNFYWAWLSGRLAGLSAAAQSQNASSAKPAKELQHHV